MKKVFVLSLISILVFSATFFSPFHTKSDPNEDPTNYNIIPLTYTILEEKEEHIFLDSKESITFNAPLNLKEFHFTRTHATIGSPNSLFLREMNTDLFIETYNYWGENLGGWTDNNEFTIINPKEEKQELFLKISNRYSHRNYVKGFFSGIEHTINFKTQYPADRVSVNWGFTASLKILEINGTQINVADMLSLNNVSIMTEYTFRGISFLMPSPWKIEKTTFNIVIEEIDLPERPNSPRINAWIYPETVVTLNAHQQFDYQIPEIEGWSYSNAGFASNVTPSLHPTPYPFELINLAVWNPNENPVSTTPIDMNFGIRNISNKTYNLGFYPTLYYWQNQTGIQYTHQVNITETEIYHTYFVNISDSTIDSHLGLRGHYLSFGAAGKTITFDAPEMVGKFSNSYIPLKEGAYTLVTVEPKIEHNISIINNDIDLSAALNVSVFYEQDPFANAEISIEQKGFFTQKSYKMFTDENGQASVCIASGVPDFEELKFSIKKDEFNYVTRVVNITLGSLWILFAITILIGIMLIVIYQLKFKKKKNSKKTD